MLDTAWILAGLAPLLGVVLLSSTTAAAESGFLDRTVVVAGETHRYQVYVPREYVTSRHARAGTPGPESVGGDPLGEPGVAAWPVLLFLHGAGERGRDGMRQTAVGLPASIRWDASRWPALVVCPQVPEEENWQGQAGDVALAALDATLAEFHTDPSRVVLTGLSMGGMGTWHLGQQHPERFAALVPVCGFVAGVLRYPALLPGSADPYAELAARVSSLPVWIVHGDADTVVPVEESRKMAAALTALGADVHYTELSGVGHNAWDAAYGLPEINAWILAQRRR